MRIGLVGTGRIGGFHASTPSALEDVVQVVVTEAGELSRTIGRAVEMLEIGAAG